ncbi:hypothetical protein [Shinella sp. BYT-45]|uniref:hypothetical protein n=1 Tax=Shinella sp. BYT-45 TaxID=3377377 RepID=UPI003980FAB8
MSGWGLLEPEDLDVLQEAFERVRARMQIERQSEEATQMARYLFDLYASGVVTVPELVRQTVEARTGQKARSG